MECISHQNDLHQYGILSLLLLVLYIRFMPTKICAIFNGTECENLMSYQIMNKEGLDEPAKIWQSRLTRAFVARRHKLWM